MNAGGGGAEGYARPPPHIFDWWGLSRMGIRPGGEVSRWGIILMRNGPSWNLSWWGVVPSGELFWWGLA